jgi:enoyl-CoA hydratase/carnithine racemase
MVAALLGRNIGRKMMTELLLLGQRIDAAEALRLGLVNRVVPAGELDAAVADWAAQLAAKSPLLVKLGKDALFHQQDMAFDDALEYGPTLLAQTAHDRARRHRRVREPRWTGG